MMIIFNSSKGDLIFFSLLSYVIFFVFLSPYFFLDKLSFLMGLLVLLIYFIVFICCNMVFMFYSKGNMVNLFFLFMLFMLFMCFYYSNMLLFYMFFEFSVIPIFIFIMSWGTESSKILASFFLFFFTFFSSFLFFLGLFLVFMVYGTFSFYLLFFNILEGESNLFFFFMLVVFFVKMPIFIFHIWLPLAHVESPMLGSMVLASIMLKLGGYGIMRMLMIFYYNYFYLKFYFFVWGIWGACMMSFVCLSQVDLKKIVAYSSISHMSMIFMSLFSMNFVGKLGFIFMMLSHGVISSLMFFGLGVLYYRFFSRNLFSLTGSLMIIPLYGFWWFIIGLMNLGFPPFISFLSEFFIFFSMILFNELFLILGLILIMISSIYTVNLMVYLISGLKKNFNLSFELYMIEHLIFFLHSFLLVFSIFFYWMI